MKALRRRTRFTTEIREVLVEGETATEQPLSLSESCRTQLKRTRVAVVGGGLAGLAAARRLGLHGVSVTLYEARPQVGGRVLSNHTFSSGRITEEGAELIGSFHTRWLTLARRYGLSMISRMDDALYKQAGLEVKLRLDKDLTAAEVTRVADDMWVVLEKIARDASQIRDARKPWDDPTLKKYDDMSVASALENIYHVQPGGRTWKALQFLLVNNEVVPLEDMNFLGLLCKAKGGQGMMLDGESLQTGYWETLETLRCADGCQKLASQMANEIKARYKAELKLRRAVTDIKLSRTGVEVRSRPVIDHRKGTLGPGPSDTFRCDYVILAIPPSVWGGVTVTTDDGKANPGDQIGMIGMGPAVKFFSDVKERFWIKDNAAPYGGSLTFGQVWEGTDNQTRVDPRVAKQGIVLSVFAGPTVTGSSGPRVPTRDECEKGLRELYPGYAGNVIKSLFSDWPKVPFIRTGYAAPRKSEIFTIAKRLSEPFHSRLFFAGEHTQMDFFGYMEGGLRSGERAANDVVLQSCGLPGKHAPPTGDSRPRVAIAAPNPGKPVREHESETESPFLHEEPFVAGMEEEWKPLAATLALESPFLQPRIGAVEVEGFTADEDADPAAGSTAEVDESFELENRSDEFGEEGGDGFPEFEEQILTLPAGLPGLPSDGALRGQLQAIGTAEARALDAAFAVFGDPAKFINKLPPALNAAFKPLGGGPQQRFRIHVTRLGAEAFVLDSTIEPDARFADFVDHPDRLDVAFTPEEKRNFLHFAVRRLHQISPIVVKPLTHQRQMDRAAALFRRFQVELANDLSAFRDKALPLAYRTLAMQIMWRHYQALQDLVLEAAAKTRLNWAAAGRKWEADLRKAAVTGAADDADATAPTFRLTPTVYRDYFSPSTASDIRFGHFTATPIPFSGHGPDISFRSVLRRRAEQRAFIERLRNERDPLPKLHDTASWQAWVRETWDMPLLRKETKLEAILKHVGGYFEAFTVHVPHDLAEGCATKNYLTRAFPRAITGSLAHDCFVYAVRWLHMLGRLLSPGSTPSGIANPRIFLVEMPAHVGVMIRADTALNRHVVVSINNKHAEIHESDPGETDKAAAEIVVRDTYRGPRTPCFLRPLASKPADAKALWDEVCKLADRKLTLPYKDSKFPPHLRYLKHNALVASISREHADAVRASWAALHQRLGAAKDRSGHVLPARISEEIRRHAANFEKAFQSALARLDRERKPLIEEINADLAANPNRVPKGVSIVETIPFVPFSHTAAAYRKALEEATRSRNLPAIDPADFFPEDDFVAAVE